MSCVVFIPYINGFSLRKGLWWPFCALLFSSDFLTYECINFKDVGQCFYPKDYAVFNSGISDV